MVGFPLRLIEGSPTKKRLPEILLVLPKLKEAGLVIWMSPSTCPLILVFSNTNIGFADKFGPVKPDKAVHSHHESIFILLGINLQQDPPSSQFIF